MSQQNLEKARTSLLDLGLRNNFINSKDSKTKSVRVIEESSEEIFKILVDNNYLMTFQARGQDDNTEDEFSELYKILPTEEVDISLLTDTILQTPHPPSELQQRLRSVDRYAKLSIEEKGVNMLFLALGFVKWFESQESKIPRLAPIILIPVELKRLTLNSKFKIRYNEDEIGLNISFLEKLKLEYGIKLDLPNEITSDSLLEIFNTIEKAITLPKWELQKDEIRLGLFSFSKFLMYNDLNEVQWGEQIKPYDHPLLSSFLGDGFNTNGSLIIGDEKFNDDVSLKDTYHVLPADSSQQEVIFSIREGLNAVVQGPPGTGKSQTITNIIVDFLARGKKVLFVAEKLAALNVVISRLDALGLGKVCLELHSDKANKKLFLDELGQVLNLNMPIINIDIETELQNGDSLRDFINSYATAVNTQIGKTGFTPIQCFGEVLKYATELENIIYDIDLDRIGDQSKEQYESVKVLVDDIAGQLKKSGSIKNNPFRMIRPIGFSFYDGEIFIRDIGKIIDPLKSLVNKLHSKVNVLINDTIKFNLVDLPKLEFTIRKVNEIDSSFLALNHIALKSISYNKIEELKKICKVNIEINSKFINANTKVYAKFWDFDCFEVYQNILRDHSKWYKFILGSYKRAKSTFRTYLKQQKFNDKEALELLKLNIDLSEISLLNQKFDEDLRRLTNGQFNNENFKWDRFLNSLEWAEEIMRLLDKDEVCLFVWDWAWKTKELPAFEEELQALNACIENLEKTIQLAKPEKTFDLRAQDLNLIVSILEGWVDHKEELNDYIQIVKNVDLLSNSGLDWLKEILENWEYAGQYFSEIFNYYWFKNIARIALRERSVLDRFVGSNHNDKISSFNRMEDILLKINIYRVLMTHWSNLPKSNHESGRLGILKKELSKKRKLKPIRTLISECGDVILDLKPLFLMSPMSVAQFIKEKSLDFDLVVFDEASQIKPVEAFGSILRGKQVVIVGDSKQLPPTSFFDSGIEDEEDEEFVPDDVESILALAQAKNMDEKMLRWHYRSRHESLITISNREFYNSDLLVFPSAHRNTNELGLKHVHTQGTYYAPDKGGRVNRGEAKLIVGEIIKHATTTPNKTLGVVAFSQSQAKIIEDYLEQELRINPNPKAEKYLYNEHINEKFFVKNLENVQGDERDIIFISLGYGHQENGRFSYSFGPINKEGGERRLNVLFSRAKSKCVVFSNFKGDELDLSRTDSLGVKVLKSYLIFAERGEIEIPSSTGGGAESVFEEQVASFLTNNGIEIETQVGSAGFRIDMAVKHPVDKGKYLLAIECDGASYHSSKIARDRDKARQIILESLGWRFYRIWSTDWFLNTKRESAQLLDFVQNILKGDIKSTELKSQVFEDKTITISSDDNLNQELADNFRYVKFDIEQSISQPLHEYGDLYKLIFKIIEVEEPVHKEVITSRVLELTGTKKAGSRIQAHIDSEIDYLLDISNRATGSFHENGAPVRSFEDFYFINPNLQKPDKNGLMRERSSLSLREFDLKLVSPFEIWNSILYLIDTSYGITFDEIVTEVPKIFGYKRITEQQKEIVSEHIKVLIGQRIIREEGKLLRII